MRPICVICTDIFVINSHISACNCGHLFHEECLSKWIKSTNSNHQTCPQCRAKISNSTIIKRLYLTEADLSSSQLSATSFSLGNILSEAEQSSNPNIAKECEKLLVLCEDLKHNLKEKTELLSSKSKLIEQKDASIKNLEEGLMNSKKKYNENLVLVDYLKKELESYSKMKELQEQRDKRLAQLELKLHEYKSIDLIYKEHENEFENEMKKYLAHSNPSHQATIVRQLVSTNVLLKKNLDKQTEEKKIFRMKLASMEKSQSDKEKFMLKKQQVEKELQAKVAKLEADLLAKTKELNQLKSSNQSPTPNQIAQANIEDKMSKNSTPNLSTNDSDLDYLKDLSKIENSYLKKKDESGEVTSIENDPDIINDSITSAQVVENVNLINLNKRKNPFRKSDSFPRSNQIESNNSSQSEDDNDEKQKSPPSKMNNFNFSRLLTKDSPDIGMVRPIKMINKMKSTTSILSRNENKLNETTAMRPLPVSSSNLFYDGLGGRKKVFAASSNTLSKNKTSTSSNKLTRFKVT